jgi:hypothetical protein
LKWAEQHNVLTDAQFGFCPGFGTTDANFALHSLITSTLHKGKRLYCCFVDNTRAFDSVTHSKLWQKLVRNNLLFNSPVKSFPTCDTNEIPRQFLGSLTSPFLNTGIIILCTHNSGYIPVFIILLKSFPKIGIKYALL